MAPTPLTLTTPSQAAPTDITFPQGIFSIPQGSNSPNQRYRFIGSDQGIVEDTTTKLQWQRCSVGQTWNRKSCTGLAQSYAWGKAQKLAVKGWRLPTRDELITLVYCSSGQPNHWRRDAADKGFTCEGDYNSPTIMEDVFPNTPANWFWSSLPYAGYADFAWVVFFNNGYIYHNNKIYAGFVRLVRGGD